VRTVTRFTVAAIEKHIRRKHPGCPDFAVTYFASEIAKKDWTSATLGMAVGITMQNILRHSMTDYDHLILIGLDREEARRRVQPKVNAMIAAWKGRPQWDCKAGNVDARSFAEELLITDRAVLDHLMED
jgi:hypothetical protein